MTDPFEHDDAEWVEICDADGKRSSMRLLATIGFAGKNYYLLGAQQEREDGEEEQGLLLLREDQTIDGAQEYVIADDESEVESVVGRFVMQSIMQMVTSAVAEGYNPEDCPCGEEHQPNEFCYCGNPDYLQ